MKLPIYHIILALVLLVVGAMVTSLLAAETPHGRLTGTLVSADTGQALAHVPVALTSTDKAQLTYRTTTDAQGRFAFRHLPVAQYSLTADTNAHQQPEQVIAIKEGRLTDELFELQPTDPFLRVLQSQRVFTTREAARLRCHGFVPTDTLTVTLYRIAPTAAIAGWHSYLPNALTLHGQNLETADLGAIPELTVAGTRRVAVGEKARDAEGVFRQEVSLGKLPPALYLMVVQALSLRTLAVLAVTDLGLVVKAAPQQALIYSVDIETGAPLPGVEVDVRSGKKSLARGKTGNNGLLALTLPAIEDYEEITAVGHAGDSLAIANLYAYWNTRGDAMRVYSYTDRPVYRPGHTVSYKSVLRELHGDTYTVPSPTTVRVRVVDGRENIVYAGQQTTSAYGSLADTFPLSANALPGIYTLTVFANGGSYESSFSVAEYRKPEFEVTVTTARKRYHRGETVQATIAAHYYYGAPVPDAEVDYYITRSPSWYYGESETWDADLDEADGSGGMDYGEGEMVSSAKGHTDENGRLAISFQPGKQDAKANDSEDWRYTVHAMITDAGRRMENGAGSVLITQGEFRLQSEVEDWVAAPGQAVKVSIHAIDYDNHPVASVRGTATFARAEWDNGQEQLYDRVTQAWTTDADGRATITVTPQRNGDYRILLATADAQGNRITGTGWLWVMSGNTASFNYPYQDLDVRADKKLYREGDIAQIIVNTRHTGQMALVTIEGARILDKRLVELKGKSNIIAVKIRPEFLPVARVSINLVRHKQLYSGDAILNVSRERKALRVTITPDKPVYQPGQPAVYRVKTTTPDGKPAPAEVSLGVVDEAIYAIAPENAENIVSFFYPKRNLEVQTAFSFPEVYLSGDDKAGSKIRTRRFFPDTAFWAPATVTDARGEASFHFTMPDNLTTWRATCRAATRETRVGQATATALVNKPFLVRVEPPRFFTQGDRVRIAVVAHNLTQGDLLATVGLESKGLTLDGQSRVQVRVPAGRMQRLEWQATAPDIGRVSLRAWAQAGQLSDALELTLPVLAKGRIYVNTLAGLVNGSAELSFDGATGKSPVIPGTRRLTVRLTPSLASAMLSSLDYLAHYPYGCVEQTLSAFLPDVAILQTLHALHIANPSLEKALPDMVQAGLLKLYAMQHDDNGWGWWAYDETNPWMTAYVVYGLVQAREAGFTVNERILANGVSALEKMAANTGLDAETRAYLAYVLTLAGKTDAAGNVVAFYLGPQGNYRLRGVNDWGRLMLAQAMHNLGHDDKARAILTDVWSRFAQGNVMTPSGEHWWSETDLAAALLSSACALTPRDPRLPELVRWLMAHRNDNHWSSTRDTAFVLYALSCYLRTTQELTPDLQATVTVNGRVMATRHFTAADVFTPEYELTLHPDEGWRAGPVNLRITTTGSGRLYYTAELRQVVAQDLTVPVRNTSTLVVERSYRKFTPSRMPGRSSAEGAVSTAQTTFAAGDIIEVTLTVRTQRHNEYLMLEDPLPAGCEANDRGPVEPWEWSDWWCDQIVRDQLTGFALRRLDPGARRITYYITAQTPGRFTALPPRVYDMYHPDVHGDGMAQTITIRP